MPSRTQIVCLHEGKRGSSIDPVFINKLLRSLAPPWIRPFKGSNVVRLVGCGGRKELVAFFPSELRACIAKGGDTTLMVWADLDDDMADGEALKRQFWLKAEEAGFARDEFEQVVFIFAKDRIENWIEHLSTGSTDESSEGPRVNGKVAAAAAIELARRCQRQTAAPRLPPSLEWSCQNWRKLVKRMTDS